MLYHAMEVNDEKVNYQFVSIFYTYVALKINKMSR